MRSLLCYGVALLLSGSSFAATTEPPYFLSHLSQRLQQQINRQQDNYEAQLIQSLLKLKQGQLDAAIAGVEALRQQVPNFHLAHLVYADLLSMRRGVVGDIGIAAEMADSSAEQRLNNLRSELMTRLDNLLTPPPEGAIPQSLLLLNEQTPDALVVDKQAHRLYHYRWNHQTRQPELQEHLYVSTGRLTGNKQSTGDLKTPEGVYFTTRYIPDEQLPEKYGHFAFTLNYPNELDLKQQKSGHGIWLHGTERIYYSRPPLDSEGCVVLPNRDLERLKRYLQPGITPVIVTDRIEWITVSEWQQRQQEGVAALQSWLASWQSGDVERYLRHYAEGFWSDSGEGLAAWQSRKRKLAATKTYQQIELEQLTLFAYPVLSPSGQPLLVANFTQNYRSNNYQNVMRKRLYLTHQGSGWKILYEGEQ